jgi:hypothetical protein
MKKLLALLAIFFASPVLAVDHIDLLSGLYSTEDGNPYRIQYVTRHRLGTDVLSLRGISNIDFDDDGNWTRIQLKPRLLIQHRFESGFSIHAVDQFEYFETRRFDRKANRVGAGVGYSNKAVSVEVNYLATDSLTDNARWDTYFNYRFAKKWAFNNLLWYIPKTDQKIWQPSISYSFTKHFRVQAQYRVFTDHDDATLVGIAWRF